MIKRVCYMLKFSRRRRSPRMALGLGLSFMTIINVEKMSCQSFGSHK